MQTDNQKKGNWGEEKALEYLLQQGYAIRTRNFHTRDGEIDIIMSGHYEGHQALAFVEVKTRQYDDGSAERSVDMRKRAKMLKATREYCRQKCIDVDDFVILFLCMVVCGNEKKHSVHVYDLP